MHFRIRNIKKHNIYSVMVFLIGFFSTFQIIDVFGMTPFTVLLFAFTFLLLMSGRIKYDSNNRYVGRFFLAATISELMILTIPLENKRLWIIASIKQYIVFAALVIVYFYLAECNSERKQLFFKAVYLSCVVEVIWCYLQYFFYKLADININDIIWGTYQVNTKGNFVLTGLNVNAGILAPAVVFFVVFSKNIILKILGLGVFFIAGSSTMMICGIVLVISTFLCIQKGRPLRTRHFEEIVFVSGVVILSAVIILNMNSSILERICDIFNTLIYRLNTVRSGNFTDGSTFTHTRYYTSIPNVLRQSGMLNVIWGYGKGCSGVPFVNIYNQYPDIVYVPESDIVTYLYDFGLMGFSIMYSFFIKLFIKGHKIDTRYSVFTITLLVGGVFYGMQLNWVLLIEWLMFNFIKNKTKFEYL